MDTHTGVGPFIIFVTLAGGGFGAASLQAPPVPATGAELAARVIARPQSPGMIGQVRLVRGDGAAGTRTVTLLRVKTRQEGPATLRLYQVTGPPGAPRQALLLRMDADGRTSGTWFEGPDTMLPLRSRADLAHPVFGSDLRAVDFTDDVFRWPGQEVVGAETVMGRPCLILESRPPVGTLPSTLVRSWIASALDLPLRIDWVGSDREVLRRLRVDRVARVDGVWTPVSLTAEAGHGRSRTTLEAIRATRRVTVPAAEFDPDTIRAALRGSDQPARRFGGER